MPDDRRWWLDQLVWPAAANAIGTLTAALVVFIVGVAAGVITDVSLREWASIGLAALGVAAGALAQQRHARWRDTRAQADAKATLTDLVENDPDTFRLLSASRPLTAEETEQLMRGLRESIRRREGR